MVPAVMVPRKALPSRGELPTQPAASALRPRGQGSAVGRPHSPLDAAEKMEPDEVKYVSEDHTQVPGLSHEHILSSCGRPG